MKKLILFLLLLLPLTIIAQDLEVVASASERFESVTNISVVGEFCKVNVIKGEAVSVIGELKANKKLEGYAITFKEETGGLKINVQKPESGWTTHTGVVEITVPNGVNVDVVTTSGYITMNSIICSAISAQSKSGKIVVNNLEGKVILKSESASVKATALKGQLSILTKAGTQVVRNIDGMAHLSSDGGSISVEKVVGVLKTESTAGSQTIREVQGDVNLKTMSGVMKLSDATGNIQSLSAAGTLNLFDVSGTFNLVSTKGSIIGTRVKLEASSGFKTTEGKIKLKMNNPKEQLSFLCESENAYIVAFGKSKKKKLKMGSGAIVITGISTTGAQNYY